MKNVKNNCACVFNGARRVRVFTPRTQPLVSGTSHDAQKVIKIGTEITSENYSNTGSHFVFFICYSSLSSLQSNVCVKSVNIRSVYSTNRMTLEPIPSCKMANKIILTFNICVNENYSTYYYFYFFTFVW